MRHYLFYSIFTYLPLCELTNERENTPVYYNFTPLRATVQVGRGID